MTADTFDLDDWQTWPIPADSVLTRWENGAPRRLDDYGRGWVDGFRLAIEMGMRL